MVPEDEEKIILITENNKEVKLKACLASFSVHALFVYKLVTHLMEVNVEDSICIKLLLFLAFIFTFFESNKFFLPKAIKI